MTTTSLNAIIENRQRRSFAKLLLEGRAFLALILIIVVFSLLSPNYLTVENVLIMASHVAIYALLALGMLVVILNGGIDLSVGSTLGFSAVVAGYLLQGVPISILGITLYPSVPVVVLLSCGVGAFVGLVNGVLVSRFNVAPFVATLGMLYVVRGIALLMTNGLTINDLAGEEPIGNTGFDWLGFNRILNVPIGVLIMAAVAIVLGVALSRSRFGRWLYASGGNERAAELSGVPVRRVKVQVYVISGVCASLAGIILASTLTSASPTAGDTYELTAIAAVVIGGAALTGGRGTVRGTLLGAFVIGFLSDGLVIVGVSAYWQTVFMGAVIVVAVLLNTLQYGRRRRAPAAPAAPAAGGAAPADPPPAAPAAEPADAVPGDRAARRPSERG
jgi:erythritol transport system permease protein